MRPIDADALYKEICDLEAQALAYVRDETDQDNLRDWSAILAERTAFKHDVFDAPTIEPEPQWIPCSERLPEPRMAVLGYAPRYQNIYALYYDSVDGWMVWSPVCDDFFPNSQGEIVAWMPLPEPYKEDTDE